MRQAVEEVGREKMREKEMEKGMLMREKNMKETREQVEEKGGKEDVERWARQMGGEDWKGLLAAYWKEKETENEKEEEEDDYPSDHSNLPGKERRRRRKLRAAANQATAQWRQTAEGKEQKRKWEEVGGQDRK